MVWLPFIIFPYIGNNHPYWLIFFRGVQSTNQSWKSVVIPGCGLVRWIQPLWHPHLAPWHRGTSAQAQPRWKMTMMRVCQRRSSNLPFGEFLCHSCNTKYAIHVWVICWDGLIWYDSSHFSSWNVCVYIYIYIQLYTHDMCKSGLSSIYPPKSFLLQKRHKNLSWFIRSTRPMFGSGGWKSPDLYRTGW